MTAEPHWDHFEDERGLGVIGVGGSLASAFGEAARGLTALVTDLGKVRLRDDAEIKLPGAAPENLLPAWLNAVIAEMDARQMLFGDFELYIDERELVARLYGEPLDPHRHHPAARLKRAVAVPEIRQEDVDTWIVSCVIEVDKG
jgi:SHS2 domain-containing protein